LSMGKDHSLVTRNQPMFSLLTSVNSGTTGVAPPGRVVGATPDCCHEYGLLADRSGQGVDGGSPIRVRRTFSQDPVMRASASMHSCGSAPASAVFSRAQSANTTCRRTGSHTRGRTGAVRRGFERGFGRRRCGGGGLSGGG
jgi:hypothetical protein